MTTAPGKEEDGDEQYLSSEEDQNVSRVLGDVDLQHWYNTSFQVVGFRCLWNTTECKYGPS